MKKYPLNTTQLSRVFSVSYFIQLLRFLSSESQAAPLYGYTSTSPRPCLRLKYTSTQRTTSPVNYIILLYMLICYDKLY